MKQKAIADYLLAIFPIDKKPVGKIMNVNSVLWNKNGQTYSVSQQDIPT